jgi:hypothetical protein
MRKTLIIVFAGILFTGAAQAQAAKSIYFEIGGPGLASFNFDTRFGNREDGFGGRIGVGGFSVEGSGVVFFPVGLNYILGKDQRNYFEIGGGVTPLVASGDFSDDDGTFTTTFGHALFGYRMQPRDGGFTFRAFISPIFGSFGFIPYYGGVSFGYKFGSGKRNTER